jgi:hypothetical protein
MPAAEGERAGGVVMDADVPEMKLSAGHQARRGCLVIAPSEPAALPP